MNGRRNVAHTMVMNTLTVGMAAVSSVKWYHCVWDNIHRTHRGLEVNLLVIILFFYTSDYVSMTMPLPPYQWLPSADSP